MNEDESSSTSSPRFQYQTPQIDMPRRITQRTIASLPSSEVTVKAEPSSIRVRGEPSDDDSFENYNDSRMLSRHEMYSNLSAMCKQPLVVYHVVESDMLASCCNQPLEHGQSILTTYKRGKQEVANFQGPPTNFNSTLDRNGCEKSLKKRSGRFYHTSNAHNSEIPCLDRAIREEVDLWLVRCSQKADLGKARGGLSCESCGNRTKVAGYRRTVQLGVGTEGLLHVYCADGDCVERGYDKIVTSLGDVKGSLEDGTVTYRSVNTPVQFQMISQCTVGEISAFTGQEEVVVVNGLREISTETSWL